MQPPLTDVEVRVLGALLEKEATTPDNYPLSLNALQAACNQTTNREPVMRLDEDAVVAAAVALRRRYLLRQIQPAGSRVTKFEHLLGQELRLDRRELAVLGVLMLRGPQTPGELYARTARLEPFADLADLEGVLESLIAREPEPLVARLPRRAGAEGSPLRAPAKWRAAGRCARYGGSAGRPHPPRPCGRGPRGGAGADGGGAAGGGRGPARRARRLPGTVPVSAAATHLPPTCREPEIEVRVRVCSRLYLPDGNPI